MAKEIIIHQITDWSKIDEKEGFWGRVDLLRPDINFGIHRYNNELWTSGMVGIGRLFDKNSIPVQDNGKEHILVIKSSYDLEPWHMLETVMLDDEYDAYMAELEVENKYLFNIFYDQPLIKVPQGIDNEAEILFALSYVNACHSLCKKGLKKSLIYHEENFTAKLRGKINVNKNIKHNTAKGRNDKFYCRYVDFTEDTVENRIVKAALLKCQGMLKDRFHDETSVKSKINFCLNSLRRVSTSIIKNTDFNTSCVGGLYSYYKPVIQQARAILSMNLKSYPEDVSKATGKYIYMIPYAINMETLFEYYARTELKKAIGTSQYRVGKYSTKLFLQKDVQSTEDGEKGIHLMPFCIPDIIIYEGNEPIIVIDAKYKLSSRADRSDSHQLMTYVLLTGVQKCGFIFPGKTTKVREMKSSGDDYLCLSPKNLRYYEMFLGGICNDAELKKVLT